MSFISVFVHTNVRVKANIDDVQENQFPSIPISVHARTKITSLPLCAKVGHLIGHAEPLTLLFASMRTKLDS